MTVSINGAAREMGGVASADLLGIRIITYFRDGVDAVAKLIEREFSVDRDNSVDKRAVLEADRFGYLSLHYVAEFASQCQLAFAVDDGRFCAED